MTAAPTDPRPDDDPPAAVPQDAPSRDAPSPDASADPLGLDPAPTAEEVEAVRRSRVRRLGDGAVAMVWEAIRDSALVAGRAYKHFDLNEGWILSGYIAYSVLLAMFPFLIFTAAFASAMAGPGGLTAALDWLFEQAPPNVAEFLAPVLRDVLGQDRGGLLTVSAAGAVWAASNGVEAFRAAFDRAYDAPRVRGFVLRRLIGIAYVFLGSATFALLGFAIVLAPLITHAVEFLTGVVISSGVGALRYGAGGAVFIAFLWALHRFLPSRPQDGARLLPGIVSTLLIWMAGATAFSLYLSHAPSYSVTYGGIAGVIVTLLFFYLTGAAIIFGAEINAALERLTGEARERREAELSAMSAEEAKLHARDRRRAAARAAREARAAERKAAKAAARGAGRR